MEPPAPADRPSPQVPSQPEPPAGSPPAGSPPAGVPPVAPPAGADVPPPGWSPPPPPAGRDRQTTGLLIGVAAGLVFLCGATTLLAYLTGAIGGDGPAEVVEDYVAALAEGDCERLMELLTDETFTGDGYQSRAEAVADCEAEWDGESGVDITVDNVRVISETRDTAVVAATVWVPDESGQPESGDFTVTLQREDGDWRIDGTQCLGLFC